MVRTCTERLLRLVVGSALLASCSSNNPLGGGKSWNAPGGTSFDVRGFQEQILRDSGESSSKENTSANLPAAWSSTAGLGRTRAARRNPESLLEEAMLATAPTSDAHPDALLALDALQMGAKLEGVDGEEGAGQGVDESGEAAGDGSPCSPCAGQPSGVPGDAGGGSLDRLGRIPSPSRSSFSREGGRSEEGD
ncbi:hypothetical protein T484DRAFT_1896708, partial [Baffinella frigidus]